MYIHTYRPTHTQTQEIAAPGAKRRQHQLPLPSGGNGKSSSRRHFFALRVDLARICVLIDLLTHNSARKPTIPREMRIYFGRNEVECSQVAM
jgi:hypothetical protein